MDDDNNNDHNNIDDDNLADARRQPILLTPEGQQLFDVLDSYIKQELPPYTNNTMNEMVNTMAAGGEEEEKEFLATVRASVVACLFGRDNNDRIITDEQRGLTTTIVDKEEWPKEEKRIETALRLFPNILLEQFGGYYPIQWLAMKEADGTYNLQNVSLLPMVIELNLELQQFSEESRGGLLVQPTTGWNALKKIICYFTKDNENNELRDDCFSIVRNWMKGNNYLVTEDIQQHNLVGEMCTMCMNTPNFSVSRLWYLINMDPVSLTLPCNPEKGSMVPIHWSFEEEDIGIFSMLLKAGMKYYPDKFGFVFSEGTYRNDNTGPLFREIPFQEACKQYGQEKVINAVIDCIKEYCSTSSSTSATTTTTTTTTTTITETSLLMSAITDATIHIDGVYILLRKDPEAALLKLQQKLRLLVREEVYTVTDTNTHTNTNNSNNKNTNGVISNDNDNDTTLCVLNSTSSSISTTNTITAAAAAAVSVSSSTANNNNNNNNDDNHIQNYNYNRDNGNASHQPSSSLSSPHLKGKKRKYKMV